MSMVYVLQNGKWLQAEIVGYGSQGMLAYARLNQTVVAFTITGTSFSPIIELVNGSAATVTWIDLDTGAQIALGTAPALAWSVNQTRHIGFRVELPTGAQAFGDVVTLNLGFDNSVDTGRFSLGTGYNHPSQPVNAISGLSLLTGLRRFLADNTPLSGTLDLTGLGNLEFVECYSAHFTNIILTGCTKLVRLNIENNNLTTLDLNPVKNCLYDLRAAIQRGGSPTFTSLTGAMTHLYHYCIRDQTVCSIIPHAQLPLIEEYWVWNTGQTTADAPTSTLIRSYLGANNPLDQSSVDLILTTLASSVTNGAGRSINISGGAVPSSSGQAAVTTLTNNGWSVTTS